MASLLAGLFKTRAAASSDDAGCNVQWAPPSSPLASVFKLLDQNGDGVLSVQEMSQGFHKLGVDLPPPLLSSLLLSSCHLSRPGFLLFHEFQALYASVCHDLSSTHPHDAHSCHACIHGAIPCEPPSPHNDDIHCSSPYHHDNSSTSCNNDIEDDVVSDMPYNDGASIEDDVVSDMPYNDGELDKSCKDDGLHHHHIHLGTSSCVVHSCSDLSEASQDHDELSSGNDCCRDDVHMFHDQDDDDLLEAFRIFDKNADGFISMPELQSVMCNLGFSQCHDDGFCQGILQRVDTNGDGFVDFSEFKHMMLSAHII